MLPKNENAPLVVAGDDQADPQHERILPENPPLVVAGDDQADQQQKRILPQEVRGLLRELKQITILIVIVPTFACLGLKLLTITSEGPRHVAPLYYPQKLLKIGLFVYSIGYTYWIFACKKLKVCRCLCRPNEEEIEPRRRRLLGSITLRLITLSLAGALFFFVLISLFLCFKEWEWSFEQKSCAAGPNFDKLIEVNFILGVALFVFWNDLYESGSLPSLLSKFVLLSASLYKYLSIVILECIYIAEEVYHKYNDSTVTFNLIPVHKDGPYFLPLHTEHDEDCKDGSFECLMKEYVEMFYVAISELLLIAICIIWSKIHQTGELLTPRQHKKLSLGGKIKLIGAFIIFFVLVQLLLIYVYGYKKITDGLAAKLILSGIHLSIVAIGLIGCIYLGLKDERIDRNIPEIREPLDILDKNLINVGMVGIVAYTIMGSIHSYNLITGNYSTLYGWLSLSVNLTSLAQTVFQTLTMLKCKMTGWKMNGALALVNFMLFSLDLFDALTLGIYANPIAGDTNLDFLLIVRLLEPFNVFYRFHSFSVLMENVEHNYNFTEATEAATRRNTDANAANGIDNEGYNA